MAFRDRCPATGDTTQFFNGNQSFAQVKDSDLSTSDITTNDFSTSKHGFTPKGTTDTAKFLRGDGAFQVGFPLITQGRLTLSSGVPITTSDVTAATTIYFTPYQGNRIALFDGTNWKLMTFAEVSVAVPAGVSQAHDVFAYDNSGTVAIETLEWANTTVTVTIASPGVVTWTAHGLSTGQVMSFTTSGALPTGLSANTQYFVTVVDANSFKLSTTLANVAAATFINTSGTQSGTHTGHAPYARQTAITLQDGVYVKSGATTRKYLGTILTTNTSGQCEDSLTKRFVWNYYNRVHRQLKKVESTATWTYTVATPRQVNLVGAGSGVNQVDVVIGVAEVMIDIDVSQMFQADQAAGTGFISGGIGEDSGNTLSTPNWIIHNLATPLSSRQQLRFNKYPGIGRRSFIWLEQALSAGTTTFYGQSNQGLFGYIQG